MITRPLRIILIIALIAAILLQVNMFTGAATTQSKVVISYIPSEPITPPGGGGVGADLPSGAAPVEVPTEGELEETHYIGDFATSRIYADVLMAPAEKWVYTYKEMNHTVSLVYINKDYAEFTISSSIQHIKLFVGGTIQIDCDLNGYSDVKITLNSIKDGKADVTLEIPFEEMLFSREIQQNNMYYLILALLVLLVIDTLYHHKKERKIFKHVEKLIK